LWHKADAFAKLTARVAFQGLFLQGNMPGSWLQPTQSQMKQGGFPRTVRPKDGYGGSLKEIQ
jgi:hypothetical protein